MRYVIFLFMRTVPITSSLGPHTRVKLSMSSRHNYLPGAATSGSGSGSPRLVACSSLSYHSLVGRH